MKTWKTQCRPPKHWKEDVKPLALRLYGHGRGGGGGAGKGRERERERERETKRMGRGGARNGLRFIAMSPCKISMQDSSHNIATEKVGLTTSVCVPYTCYSSVVGVWGLGAEPLHQ